MSVGLVEILSRFDFLPSGLPLGYVLLIRVGGSKSVEVRRVWENHDDRLKFMSRQDAFLLNESLDVGDVSQAWLVWSRAAETALADAYCFFWWSCPLSRFGSWAWFWVVFGMFGLAVTRFVRFVVMLLMFMMLLIFLVSRLFYLSFA